MRHANLCWAGLALVLCGAGAACSAVDSADSLSTSGGNPTSDNKGTDGGANDTAIGSQAPGTSLAPTDNAIILVHAAGTSAFRLCFESTSAKGTTTQATPSTDLMPQANVVGVEVGSAIRTDPLATSTPPGKVYFVPESFIRTNPTNPCSNILDAAEQGGPVKMVGEITTDLSHGVHLLVLTGCQGQPVDNSVVYTKEECGDAYDGTSNLAIKEIALTGAVRNPGTLPIDIVNLSQGLTSLAGKNAIHVSFGDLSGTTAAEGTIDSPALETVTRFPNPPALDQDAGIAQYGQLGFTVNIDGFDTIAQQSLADIQALSSPKDVPSTYYAAASNYVVLMLGSPNVTAAKTDAGITDVREQLHFLAVPVIDPKPADAGADGGGDDAGIPQP